MRAYSCDLRERVLADFDGGMGNDAVARKYRVSSRWVFKLRRQRDETGEIASRRGRSRIGLTSPSDAGCGDSGRRTCIRSTWSSSTRPPRTPR